VTELSSKILNSIESVIRFKENSKIVPLHEPFFDDTNAWKYVKNCIDTGWVSSAGDWVNKFEKEICSYTGSPYAVAVNNGTVGLRLALHLLGVRYGDEVLLPPYSFVATANSISHLGAIPHFIDIDKNSLSMSPKSLERRLEKIAYKKEGKVYNKETGRRISALLPVHVFGVPADLISLAKISKNWGIPIVEDAAEALGSWIEQNNKRTHCGLVGEIGVISFNGNKLITTGGGGVVLTKNKELAEKAKHLSTTAKIDHPWEFDHNEIGWNDRLPNLNAALGLSQLEVLEKRLLMKIELINKYKNAFQNIKEVTVFSNKHKSVSNNWLVTILLDIKDKIIAKNERDALLESSHKRKIMLRPLWKPLHKLKIYSKSPRSILKVADELEYKIICLPSSPQLIK
tara:strand:+ start:263 stop:1462 length:1200 start_codon:yes stop_codon:yes gene_type:complete